MTAPIAIFSDLAEADTQRLAAALARRLQPGDTLLLSGPIGAGKSTLARALIRARLGDPGAEVPSPTFTLVQTYPHPDGDLWHCDLYRLGHSDELLELGLEDAFDHGICLIEWPDRLGALSPDKALHVAMAAQAGGHGITLSGPSTWAPRLAGLHA